MPLERLRQIMRRLRDPKTGCEWDTAQTFATIAPYTIEEAYEVADAIAREDMDELADELGDLQLQVVFHAQMAAEAGQFTLEDVLSRICDKLERRHPHIFGDADHSPGWEELKAAERREATVHPRVHRPWGYYESIDMGDRFQVKRIVVTPGGMLSLQKHRHRAEHWVVVRGTAEVTIGDTINTVHENESIFIPIGSVHRLANQGRIPLELIEVQTGSYLGEDDIVRLDDVYKRM